MKEGMIPRIETQFKLARYHVSVNRIVQAAHALSGIFIGQPPLGEAENLQLYTAVGLLFDQIGTRRPAPLLARGAPCGSSL
jgi:hypothetical protein